MSTTKNRRRLLPDNGEELTDKEIAEYIDEADDDNENQIPVIFDIIDKYAGTYGHKYIKWFNLEIIIHSPVVEPSFQGLDQLEKLRLNMRASISAVFISLNDPAVKDAILDFYNRYPEVRDALYEWGQLQTKRKNG